MSASQYTLIFVLELLLCTFVVYGSPYLVFIAHIIDISCLEDLRDVFYNSLSGNASHFCVASSLSLLPLGHKYAPVRTPYPIYTTDLGLFGQYYVEDDLVLESFTRVPTTP
jgi:hypothetical protein